METETKKKIASLHDPVPLVTDAVSSKMTLADISRPGSLSFNKIFFFLILHTVLNFPDTG